MEMQKQIKEQIKEALKAKDQVRLGVLRGLISAMTNDLVSRGKKPDEVLTDEEVLTVISKEAKKRKDSIEQFEKGGRQDLADSEKAELEILEKYLPEQLSQEEIEKIVLQKKDALGINDKSGMGKLIGAVMVEIKGQADGNAVKKAVEKSLS